MTTYGTVSDTSGLSVIFVESADPVDLQDQVNAVIASLNTQTDVITNITLAGAGDGHIFVVMIEVAPVVGSMGGLVGGTTLGVLPTLVRCYLGGNDQELAAARIGAGVPPPLVVGPDSDPYVLFDEQFAGSAKGQRFMGLALYSLESIPTNALTPRVVAVGTANQALNAGTTILTFDSLSDAVRFSLNSPQEVQYDGTTALVASIEASVTVLQTGAGDFSVAIVINPLGTPAPLQTITSHTAAGEADNVSVLAFVALIPPLPTPQEFGILVTSGAGTAMSALLRIGV